jgi:hypothetical protein
MNANRAGAGDSQEAKNQALSECDEASVLWLATTF